MTFIREKIIPVVFLFFCLAALLHVCQLNGWLPAWQITEKPEYKLAAVPDRPSELSYLTLPVTFSMKEIQRRINEQIPKVLFDKPVTYQAREVRLKVTRTGAARVIADDKGVIRGAVPIAFKADANRAGLFKPALHTQGRLTAYVDITLDVDQNWNPVIKAKSRFKWRQRPFIRVFFRKIDVADIISAEIQRLLDTQTQVLMQRLDSQFQFRNLAKKSWQKLHAAVLVDEERRIWLTIEPKQAFLEPIEGDEDDLRTRLGLLAQVKLSEAEQKPEVVVQPLPLLEKKMPDRRGFYIGLDSQYPYELIEQKLISHMQSKDDVRVNSVVIYPTGNQLAIAQDQTFNHAVWWKQIRANSYSTGVPSLASEPWRISIGPIQPTPAREVFSKAINPADQGKASLDSVFTVGLQQQRDQYRSQLNGYLNQPLGNGLTMWSDIDAMTLLSLHPLENGLLLRSTAEGQMRLLIGF